MEMTIAEWVRAARTHGKMSQEKLGFELGVTKGNVSAWETKRHEPSFTQMRRIAELTGYPLLTHDLAKASSNWPLSDEVLEALRRAMPDTRFEVERYARYCLGLAPVSTAATGNRAA